MFTDTLLRTSPSLTLFVSLSAHLSQEACCTGRWRALTFTQKTMKLLALFHKFNMAFHLVTIHVTTNSNTNNNYYITATSVIEKTHHVTAISYEI